MKHVKWEYPIANITRVLLFFQLVFNLNPKMKKYFTSIVTNAFLFALHQIIVNNPHLWPVRKISMNH